MRRNEPSKIFLSPRERLSLEENLQVGWKWLKYTGLHPDVFVILVNQHPWSSTVRFLFTIFILLLILGYGVYQVVQLVIKSWIVDKMVETVPNVMFTISLLYVVAYQFLVWMKNCLHCEYFYSYIQFDIIDL